MPSSAVAPTLTLARFIAELDHERLPAGVRERLGNLFLEYLRVASVGERMAWSRWARDLMAAVGGAGESSVLFWPRRLDAIRATFLNATFAGSIDADDTHVGAMLHPGSIVFSAALAVGESLHAPGGEVLAAVAAGYEAMIRIALCIQPSHFRRGFQSTATCGGFGAAAASARLLFRGRNAVQQTAGTLGLVASFAGGLTQFFRSGSTVKRIHAAQAAHCGVQAALLARAGFSGPVDILEGSEGFARAYADAVDFTPLLEGLGSAFRIPEVTVKAHACSARVQAAIEGILQLSRAGGLPPEAVEEVRVGIPRVIEDRLTLPAPPDVQAAQMSLPFSVALALIRGPGQDEGFALSVADYEVAVADPIVRALAARIRCEVDAAVDAATTAEAVPARVIVRLISGAERSVYVEAPRGSPSRPFTPAEYVARFRNELTRRLPGATCDQIIAAAGDFGAVPDVAEIGRALAAGR